MEISRKAPTAKGPGDTFTGDVWIDPITRGLPSSQLTVAAVHFSPGARTAWHSHDGGQTLCVTQGRGLVQARGQEVAEIHPGDVVFAADIGMLPVGQDAAEAFYRITDAAYERHSLAVTSNIHPSGFDTIMPKTLATATVDRLLHHAHLVQTNGESPPRPGPGRQRGDRLGLNQQPGEEMATSQEN